MLFSYGNPTIILASMSRENNNQPIEEKPCYLKHELIEENPDIKHELIEENPDIIKQEMKQKEIDEKPDVKPAEICTLELLSDVKTESDVCDVCHGSFVKEE